MGWRRLLLALLLAKGSLCAAELMPWYPRNVEIQWISAFSFDHYNRVNSGGKNHRHRGYRCEYLQSATVAYGEWCGEVEFLFANSCARSFGGDSIKGTVRYQLMDDVSGDAASVVIGGSLAAVFPPSLRDISVFHNGGIEGELHLAVGREFAEWSRWSWRGWGVAGIGVADHGSPWVFGELALEKNFCNSHLVRLFTTARKGFGDKELHLCRHFHGYGPIDYTAVAVACRYSYQVDIWGLLSLEYRRRIYALNCPSGDNLYLISYNYPFGL